MGAKFPVVKEKAAVCIKVFLFLVFFKRQAVGKSRRVKSKYLYPSQKANINEDVWLVGRIFDLSPNHISLNSYLYFEHLDWLHSESVIAVLFSSTSKFSRKYDYYHLMFQLLLMKSYHILFYLMKCVKMKMSTETLQIIFWYIYFFSFQKLRRKCSLIKLCLKQLQSLQKFISCDTIFILKELK